MKRKPRPIPPIDTSLAHYILNKENLSQADIAKEYSKYRGRSITTAAISRYINGDSPSQPFWDFFLARFNPSKYLLKAS